MARAPCSPAWGWGLTPGTKPPWVTSHHRDFPDDDGKPPNFCPSDIIQGLLGRVANVLLGLLCLTTQKQCHHRSFKIQIIPLNSEVLTTPVAMSRSCHRKHFSQVRRCPHSVMVVGIVTFIKSLWVPGAVPCSLYILMH